MALDAEQVFVGNQARIWIAPTGTTLPTDVDSASFDPAFFDVGYTTRDGVKFTDSKELTNVDAHQAFNPIRRIVTGRDSSAEFSMEQWNQETFALAFGGGTWTEPSPGVFRYDPPAPETLDERSAVLVGQDGDETIAIILRRVIVTSNVETTLTRTGAALLPITLGILGVDGEQPWYFLSDADRFAPAS